MTILTQESIAITAYMAGLVGVTYDNQLGYNNVVTGVQQVVYNPSGTVRVRVKVGPGASLMIDSASGLLRACAANISSPAGFFTTSPTTGCEDHNILRPERIEVEHDSRLDTVEVIV
jgi:hypothetical protein